MQLAGAGAGASPQTVGLAPQAYGSGSVAPTATAASLPAGFDADAFARVAKMIFIRMQTANDVGDLNDLRAFTTPEMFAAVRLELQERGPSAQRTDVVRVDAEVLDVTSEADRQVVSVRFHGLIREVTEGVAEPFDEVWHLVKPSDGSREWAIAGIQQSNVALARAA
jgi:predicted lipid-binding transport protein (Tim44 family)